jgi:hypothetical protein
MKLKLLSRRGMRMLLLAGVLLSTLGAVGAQPGQHAPARLALDQFADPAFFGVWERTDALVAQGVVSRNSAYRVARRARNSMITAAKSSAYAPQLRRLARRLRAFNR